MLRDMFSRKSSFAKQSISYSKLDHVQRTLIIVIRLFLFAAFVVMLATGAPGKAFLVAILLVATYVPHFLFERGYKVALPVEFHFVAIIFLFSCIYAGTISHLYAFWPWWDDAMHGVSGIVFGFLGFMVLYTLHEQKKIKMSLKLLALFAFCFGVASGAIWEIAEYFSDTFLGTNAQHANQDTMDDIVLDALGALVVSIAGYRYLKNGKGYLHRLLSNFKYHNPQLFGSTGAPEETEAK